MGAVAVEKERVEELYRQYLPLIKKLTKMNVDLYPGVVEYDDLFGHLSLAFVELCHRYNPGKRKTAAHSRGIDFQYYVNLFLFYAALQYVDRELKYRRRVVPMDFEHDVLFGGDGTFGAVDWQQAFDAALDIMARFYPDKFEFLMVCLKSIEEFGEIDPNWVCDQLGITMTPKNLRRKFFRVLRLLSDIIHTGGKLREFL